MATLDDRITVLETTVALLIMQVQAGGLNVDGVTPVSQPVVLEPARLALEAAEEQAAKQDALPPEPVEASAPAAPSIQESDPS